MDQGSVFRPRPPVEGEILLDVTTNAFVVKIPDEWRGKVVEVTPHGASVALRFGTSTTVTVAYAQAAAVDGTTKVITPHADTGRRIVDGYPRLIAVPDWDDVYLGIDASATGVLSLALAAGE